MDSGVPKRVEFEDMLPAMAEKLGGDGLIRELCNGFELLMDRERGVITLESLRRNSAMLGLQDLREDELASMLREGDVDGDGVLSQMEFCVLMFRLSPELMEQSRAWFEEIVEDEFRRERGRDRREVFDFPGEEREDQRNERRERGKERKAWERARPDGNLESSPLH